MGGLTKNKLKRALAVIFRIRSWKLLILAVLFAFLAATFLRMDHLRMVDLRSNVLSADENGDEQEIIDSLNALNEYVHKHVIFNVIEENGRQRIVFGTGPFYLENTYLRKADEALEVARAAIAEQSTNPNGNIYQKVAEYCDALSLQYGWGFNSYYVACWEEELAKYPSESEIESEVIAKIPSTELFRYDFASPIWYPCLSGFAMLVVVVLLVWICIRGLIWIGIHAALLIIDGKK